MINQTPPTLPARLRATCPGYDDTCGCISHRAAAEIERLTAALAERDALQGQVEGLTRVPVTHYRSKGNNARIDGDDGVELYAVDYVSLSDVLALLRSAGPDTKA